MVLDEPYQDKLLDMQIFSPLLPKSAESESLGQGSEICILTSFLDDSRASHRIGGVWGLGCAIVTSKPRISVAHGDRWLSCSHSLSTVGWLCSSPRCRPPVHSGGAECQERGHPGTCSLGCSSGLGFHPCSLVLPLCACG